MALAISTSTSTAWPDCLGLSGVLILHDKGLTIFVEAQESALPLICHRLLYWSAGWLGIICGLSFIILVVVGDLELII